MDSINVLKLHTASWKDNSVTDSDGQQCANKETINELDSKYKQLIACQLLLKSLVERDEDKNEADHKLESSMEQPDVLIEASLKEQQCILDSLEAESNALRSEFLKNREKINEKIQSLKSTLVNDVKKEKECFLQAKKLRTDAENEAEALEAKTAAISKQVEDLGSTETALTKELQQLLDETDKKQLKCEQLTSVTNNMKNSNGEAGLLLSSIGLDENTKKSCTIISNDGNLCGSAAESLLKLENHLATKELVLQSLNIHGVHLDLVSESSELLFCNVNFRNDQDEFVGKFCVTGKLQRVITQIEVFKNGTGVHVPALDCWFSQEPINHRRFPQDLADVVERLVGEV
eukprot:Filipodium_phascolosomae@DN1938_c0_g1_i1.p1